jgi:hypothetical protein
MSAVSGNAVTATFGLVNTLCRRRVLQQFVGRAWRTARKFAAAVRAFSIQFFARAARAERALERADVSIVRVAGEIGVAALAVRSELKHVFFPVFSRSLPRS